MIKYALSLLATLCLTAPLAAQAPPAASPAPAPVQAADDPTRAMPPEPGETGADPSQLPATASEVPELVFFGLASLGAAMALRTAARRRV